MRQPLHPPAWPPSWTTTPSPACSQRRRRQRRCASARWRRFARGIEPGDQRALALILAALAALRLRHPRLLCALLPAVGTALGQQEQGVRSGEATPSSTLPELVSVTAALGHLAVGGLLADAGLGAPQLSPLWQQVMCHLAAAAIPGGLPSQDAALVQQAAGQLGSTLPGGPPGSFWLPPAVQRALAAGWRC